MGVQQRIRVLLDHGDTRFDTDGDHYVGDRDSHDGAVLLATCYLPLLLRTSLLLGQLIGTKSDHPSALHRQ